ncbi:hypothetical protein ASE14_08240 [Agromyces sp. Root81]|nr:hypothetical protein ASE14_08240 [Agromyces sp. Root81]
MIARIQNEHANAFADTIGERVVRRSESLFDYVSRYREPGPLARILIGPAAAIEPKHEIYTARSWMI